jgi:putative hydrolase of HD superfamily
VNDAQNLTDVLRLLLRLKSIPRTGWLDRGIPSADVESVADHVLLTALVGWMTADAALDRDRVLKLTLIHDLAEVITGDPPPYDRGDVPDAGDPDAVREFFTRRHVRSAADKANKVFAETAAVGKLRSLMPEAVADELGDLWREYEQQVSPEARFAKDLDRFEAFLQAREYGRAYPDVPLGGFTTMALEELEHPVLIALRDAMIADEESGS